MIIDLFISEVVELHSKGITLACLAKKLNISRSRLNGILKRKGKILDAEIWQRWQDIRAEYK